MAGLNGAAAANGAASGAQASKIKRVPQTWPRWAWRQAAWAVGAALHAAQAVAGPLLGLPVVRDVWASDVVQYAYAQLWNINAVFFQKLHMHHLDHVDFVGGCTKGLTAIVTGPTSGIGVETAAALARRGARLVLACRNIAKGAELKQRIEAECAHKGFPKPHVEVRQLDLSSIQSVREFCAAWVAEKRELHILINNAGIYSLGAPREVTVDGFESHMGCNHLGHYLLTLSLLPALKQGAASRPDFGARVVSVSSSMHAVAVRGVDVGDPHLAKPGAYSAERAYASSKLAQVQFTVELNRRLGSASPVKALCVHPGMVLTEVTRTLPRWMQAAHRATLGQILVTPMQGARASLHAATHPNAPKQAEATLGYFGADCRPMLPSKAAQDPVQAKWLWRWSAQQVRLPASLDLPEPKQ